MAVMDFFPAISDLSGNLLSLIKQSETGFEVEREGGWKKIELAFKKASKKERKLE